MKDARLSGAVPVIDLHLHSEAAARINALLAEAGRAEQVDWSAVQDRMAEMPRGVARMGLMNGSLDVPFLAKHDRDPRIFEARVETMLRNSAAAGAWLVEARFGSATLAVRPDLVRVFRAAESTVVCEYPEFAAEAVLTVDFRRVTNDGRGRRLLERILEARAGGLAGVDFHPDPYVTAADWTTAHRWAGVLSDAGLGITAHAGDFSLANFAPALDTPGLTRLNDAVAAARDNASIKRLARSGTTIECTITGSALLGSVRCAESHPFLELHRAGVKVSLGSDNPLRMTTSIAEEYARAAALGASVADLACFGRNAIAAAFTSERRRWAMYRRAIEAGAPPATGGGSHRW